MFSEEQLDTFLADIAQGIGRAMAARRIGSTGSAMRALCNPERDPEFAARYRDAEAEGRVFYEDRLKAEARTRALGGSDRLLEVELATHAPEYEHLRRDRVRVNGTIEHEHALVLKLDAAVLDTWPREKLLAFREALAELDGGVIDANGRELPVIDAQSDSEAT